MRIKNMTSTRVRGFDPNEIPNMTSARMEALLQEAVEVYETDPDRHQELIATYILIGQKEAKRQAAKYPPGPPNNKCKHAIITGFLCSNETGLSRGDCTPLFKLKHEDISIWTHTTREKIGHPYF
jgi:hypothetical protein